ncbi:DUF6670 family protein [Gordonia liuliyuniae]|uniref:AttH domain-containing protein n=1 Tax=Gordonia liuliyuniae TaxID=2911517 RepID=A0ABS9IU55_9ACTN|nr:DUF6670 family protein [Gordonia liuliyuniae]MCF8589094.1 hypothetical protein [Gordonia liuliyuniae]
MHHIASSAIRRVLKSALAVADSASKATGAPFNAPEILVPNLDSRRFGWTHYGLMIPDLPEPHRFLSVMSLIGATGSLAFDNDHALPCSPRRTAAVVAGTAASHPGHFGTYEFGADFSASADGSEVRFGDDLALTGGYPEYRLEGSFGGVEVDLTITCSDTVTWFFRTPVYKHLSLFGEYRGTLTTGPDSVDVSGLCSFEYGACPSPYLLTGRPLPSRLKAPLDYFVYHIVNLDDDNQVLLSQYSIGGVPLCTTAFHRNRSGTSQSFPNVSFEVTETRADPEPTPYGKPMPVPARTRFRVWDEAGNLWLDLRTVMDTPLTYGLGSGFVSGFAHESHWRGAPISGRGYLEYIDRRNG